MSGKLRIVRQKHNFFFFFFKHGPFLKYLRYEVVGNVGGLSWMGKKDRLGRVPVRSAKTFRSRAHRGGGVV